MKTKRSPADILGIVLGLAAIGLVIFSLIYLLGARPFFRGGRDWGPRHMGRLWDWNWGGPWESSEETREVAERVERLTVTNISGPVQIEGWDRDTIQVHYVKQARGEENLADFKIEIETDGDTLKVRPLYQPNVGLRFGSVSFDIKVPKTLKEIKVNNVSGNISVNDLGADIAQELETVSGAIESNRSGDLRAKSTSGSIGFSFTGRKLAVKSISGRIDGEIRGLGRDGSVEAESVSGSVDLRAFGGLDAEVRMQSVSGSLSCDFPMQIQEKKQHRLNGRIGSGSADVSLKTVSGSISLGSM